jgi:YVTN family beta-propeller protein
MKTNSRLLSAALCLAAGIPAWAANTNAYIVSSTANTVTIVDTSTSTVKATLLMGTGPSRVAVSPDGSRAYVSHPAFGYVSVIDPAVPAVTGTITTSATPGELAVTPNGQQLYVGVAGGVQVIDLAANASTGIISLTGALAELVFSADGARAFAAHGILSVIDTNTRVVTPTSVAASALALMPNGQRLYASGNAAISELDTSTNTVARTIAIPGTAGPLALTPDGSRLYAGVSGSNLVCSVYGCGGIAFRNVTAYETSTNAVIATITIPSVANRLAVTPDRSDLYMLIPSTSFSIASINTNRTRLTLALGAGVNDVAMTPNPGGPVIPYLIDAVNDAAPATLVSTSGGSAAANVLVNDTLGGIRATLSTVTLSQVSSTNPGVALNELTGAVNVEPGTPAAAHSLVYQICESASPANCDQATVTVNVRLPYVINAVDDNAVSNHGRTAVNALTNDTLNALPATAANVRVTPVVSSQPGLTISSSGMVNVALGTPLGTHSLIYRICEAASLQNCDEATVTVQVIPYAVDAMDDAGSVTRSGGMAIPSVLTNDKFGTGAATAANVKLTLVSSSSAAITLNLTTGAITVPAGTTLGVHSLVYRICESNSPTNCDQATATVNVKPYLIDAVNDYARGSSKVPNTPLLSVLSNDTLAGLRATVSTVKLSLVSISPANSKIKLDLSDGSIDVLGKTESGLYSIVYRICEIANLSNCDQATVSLDLSGSGY